MTAPSKAPEVAALGVRAHSGWAAYVVLAGDVRNPAIVARGRMTLCDPKIEGSKQPFHHAEPLVFPAAEKFVGRCRAATDKLARAALDTIADSHRIGACCVLAAGGKSLPDLRTILASHALIHTAEGEFYRDAVEAACSARDIAVRRIRERDMEAELPKLPLAVSSVRERLVEFGKQLGPPWTQDEKLSALGAWLMLASLPSRRSRR